MLTSKKPQLPIEVRRSAQVKGVEIVKRDDEVKLDIQQFTLAQWAVYDAQRDLTCKGKSLTSTKPSSWLYILENKAQYNRGTTYSDLADANSLQRQRWSHPGFDPATSQLQSK